MLRATTACTFSTSQLPKVVQEWCVLYILTSKCASRHNGVHFFNISTSKSGPRMVCFVHFDFEMCFAPQQRGAFSTSQLPKVVRPWCALYILTWKCASRHKGVHFFISPLASWLRTRRFSEPSLENTQCFPTFLPFRAPGSSFFRDFLFSDLLSSTLLFSLPLPISAFHLSILSEV